MTREASSALRGSLPSARALAGRLWRRRGSSGRLVPDAAEEPASKPPALLEAARGLGWEELDAVAELLEELDAHLGARRPPRVAVLTKGVRQWTPVIKAGYPRATVTTIDLGDHGSSAVHARLAAEGRYDAVVSDACGLGELQIALLHLRGGGALFVDLSQMRGTSDDESGGIGLDPWALVDTALTSRDSGDSSTLAAKTRRELAAAVSRTSFGSRHVVLVNRSPVLAKMREHEMDTVLAIRGPRTGSVLSSLPAQEFVPRCVLRENSAERDSRMPERYSVPAMSLREYRDVVCHPHQIVTQRNVLLPDSFRHNAAPRLRNSFLDHTGLFFGRPRKRARPVERLEGAHFYLDSEWPEHFGHTMTEQMSRLWAVAEARRVAPDLKAVLSRRREGTGLTEFERAIFGAVGIEESDIVLHHQPVHVERLLAASPMFSMPHHVHPALRELWRDIGGRLASAAPADTYPRRIFCSRRRSRRTCHNVHEVEALFEEHGFAVVYPEEMSFVAQVKMFRDAEVIAGFAGSALCTACFTPTPRRVIALAPRSYPARNEYMICAVVGHQLDYVWSEPDAEDVNGPQSRSAGFRFDFDAEGKYLTDILGSL